MRDTQNSHQHQHRLQRWRRPVAQIDIGTDAITITLHDGLFVRRVRPWYRHELGAADVHDLLSLPEQLQRAVDGCGLRRVAVDIIVPDQLVRMWMVTPPGNAAALADCEAAAQLRFAGLFGSAPSDYVISADWNAMHPFLACALPVSHLQQLEALCAKAQLTLQSVTPHFVATWNRHRARLRREAWLVTLRDGMLTLGATEQSRLIALRSAAVPSELLQQRSWLLQHIQREALLLNVPGPAALQIDGRFPQQWQKNDNGPLQCLPLDPVLP